MSGRGPVAVDPLDRHPHPEYRGGAVFPALESAVEAYARESGFPHLHAGVTSMEPMLARRGWEVFRRVTREGEEMAWMRKLG